MSSAQVSSPSTNSFSFADLPFWKHLILMVGCGALAGGLSWTLVRAGMDPASFMNPVVVGVSVFCFVLAGHVWKQGRSGVNGASIGFGLVVGGAAALGSLLATVL